jgi:hypothetical protein
MHPDEPAQRVSHETIDLALYALPRGELRKALPAQPRQGHQTGRPRSRGQDRRSGGPGPAERLEEHDLDSRAPGRSGDT